MNKENNKISWKEWCLKSGLPISAIGSIFLAGGLYLNSIISIVVGVILSLPAVIGIFLILKEDFKNDKK